MKKLISVLTALTFIISLIACDAKSSELQSQISELQSQVSSLQSEVSPSSEPIPEEDIPDVDLRALADKIVAECPPPDGVELVYDIEDFENAFKNFMEEDKTDPKFMKRYDVNSSNVIEFIRVYNPSPETGIYYFIIGKIKPDADVKAYQVAANATTRNYINLYARVKNMHPSNTINSYIYSIILSGSENEPKNAKAQQIILKSIS